MNNYKNLLAPILGNIFTGTTIRQYLSEIYIDFEISVLDKNQFENKADYLKRNLDLLDDQQSFETIIFLSEKINDSASMLKVQDTINKMRKQFPQYDFSESILNQNLVEETKHWLGKYSGALKEYLNAEVKYTEGVYTRNLLDNLRLSLELLIKELSGVNKSIENQDYVELLKNLKSKNVSSELRNMIKLLINYYGVYQNQFVKHNSEVSETEIEIIFELTSTIMKFLIRELGDSE